MRKKFIAGNWKMNKTAVEAAALANVLKGLVKKPKCDVAVCVPFTAIDAVKRVLFDTGIKVGAQNVSWADKGAFTGEISAQMLIDAGADCVIIGHSERRAMFGETDETVNKRVKQAIENDLLPIVCIGETLEEREKNVTEKVLSKQIERDFKGFSQKEMENLVVAYEPVWAIGTGKTATPVQAEEAICFIRRVLEESFKCGKAIRILYGGSMNASNARELLSMENIDGGLIGGASLIAEDFNEIIKSV